MEVIKSLENTKVKYWKKLQNKKFRDKEGLYIVEGDHLVLEAYKNKLIKEVILEYGIDTNLDWSVNYVTKEVLNKLTSMESAPTVMAVCFKLNESIIGNKVIILDTIQDPGNLGAIIRSAVAFNFDTIILGEECVDLYNDKVIRATEGMLFNINIIRRDLTQVIPILKNENYKIYGTKLNDSKNIKELYHPGKLAIVIGNEGNGIKKELLNLCDEFLSISINPLCESLNASVAASIIMYELAGEKHD